MGNSLHRGPYTGRGSRVKGCVFFFGGGGGEGYWGLGGYMCERAKRPSRGRVWEGETHGRDFLKIRIVNMRF